MLVAPQAKRILPPAFTGGSELELPGDFLLQPEIKMVATIITLRIAHFIRVLVHPLRNPDRAAQEKLGAIARPYIGRRQNGR